MGRFTSSSTVVQEVGGNLPRVGRAQNTSLLGVRKTVGKAEAERDG